MPPKKAAAGPADSVPSANEAPVEEKAAQKSDAAALRKIATHPSTVIMVKEALKELDSRKGVSSQAIQSYIKRKYPSVDLVRLKHLVRRALKKGIENGTLVRPANSTVTSGAMGKFRLAPKVKQLKPKAENVDPNVQKAAKEGAKKPKKTGATKKKDTADEQKKTSEDSKPPRKSPKDKGSAAPNVAPAKRPKAKKAEEKPNDEGTSATKTKAPKTTKEAKTGKTSQSKAAKADSEAPAAKATGKRGKKTAE